MKYIQTNVELSVSDGNRSLSPLMLWADTKEVPDRTHMQMGVSFRSRILEHVEQDQRQNRLLLGPAIEEESLIIVIPQLYSEYDI